MTVAAQTPRNQYLGNGAQTVFSFTFEVVAASDLAVYIGTTRQTLTTHYTVSGAGNDSGGTVTLVTPPSNGAVVTLIRDMPFSRTVDFQTAGPAFASDFNQDSDRNVLALQQMQERLNRGIRLGPGSEFQSNDLELNLSAQARANTVLAFDEDGDATVVALPLIVPTALTGKALHIPRVKADESTYELRSPAETRDDIDAVSRSGDTMTGTLNARAILPSTSNTYDLGSLAALWSHVYATDLVAAATGSFSFNLRSKITAPADGTLALMNAVGNDFGRLQFGGTTSSFPAIKRSAAELHLRLADDSAFASLQVNGLVVNGSSLLTASTTVFNFNTRSRLSAPADGSLLLTDSAAATFDRLQLGGTTSSFPAIKRSTSEILFRLADDSAYCVTRSQSHSVESSYVITSKGRISGGASDGVIGLFNSGATDFNRLALGGFTSSFPAIKRNGSNLEVRLADDSAFTNLLVATATANDNSNKAASTAYVDAAVSAGIGTGALAQPGYLYGLTLSTAGSSSTFSIEAGRATNSTATDLMILASAYSKTTSAWAVGSGNGSLDTGSIANSTWYHVHLIKRPDTGVVDVLISLSATAPTLPTNYTIFRRVGSMRTNGSAQWQVFYQLGDYFYIPNVTDFTTTSSSSSTLRTLSVPTGIIVQPLIGAYLSGSSSSSTMYAAPAANANVTMFLTNMSIPSGAIALGGTPTIGPPTNTSAQVFITVNTSASVQLATSGWMDTRGRI